MLRPLILLLLLFLASCAEDETQAPREDQPPVIPFQQEGELTFYSDDQERVTIAIEIADTDSARTRGLMQRTSLPEKSGMLFIFENQQPLSFWMANTPLALDLFFVDRDSQIVDIAKYTKPFSPENVASEEPGRFVIEVSAGFADTYGIVEGDRVRWRRTPSPQAP